jgi:bifunctional oligoribonuclease and PAP phosphatase NrnA
VSRYDAADWDAAVDAIKNAQTITLACHVNPDGDALGALLAMSLALRSLGKTTYPTWGSDSVVPPPSLAFMPGVDSLIQPTEVPEDADLFLALDCGASHRLGSVEKAALASNPLINIDHHPGNDGFGTLNIIVESASSTSEIIAFLLEDAGVEFDHDIATCLYTGVVTDTGRFQYGNSSPDTLRLAADLLSYGVEAPQIALHVFESAPFSYLKLLGRVLERATLFEEQRFVYSWISRKDLKETGVGADETDLLIDAVRTTRDADVAAIFKEQKDGHYRVSLRSKAGPTHPLVSVGEIARAYGGGGHELAAGFTAADVESAVRQILKHLGDRSES